MNNILNFLTNNLYWLRELFSIIFSVTGSVIAVLTYIRARSTILQPKRSEVIKIQTQVLIDFLNFISQDGNSIDSSVDYFNIYRYNFYLALNRYDLLDLSKGSEIYKEMNEKVVGWYDYDSKININGISIIKGNFEDYVSLYFGKEDLSTLHSKIIFTQKGWTFLEHLRKMSINPFLPTHIVERINQIGNDMVFNLFNIMPNIINEEMARIHSENIMNSKVGYSFKLFENTRNKHIELYKELIKDIRKYLAIDEKW